MVKSTDIVLNAVDISKSFPGVKALDNVQITLRRGEIQALMGENGAGKSTLIKVLTGAYTKDSGIVLVDGEMADIRTTEDAQRYGISTVYQEISLCANLSVAENIFIGNEPRRFGFVDWKTMNEKTKALLDELQIKVAPTTILSDCSLAVQQMIAIARAINTNCKVLILDEPTSSLDDDEVEKLFKLMRQLRDKGVGIIFVTHFLEQVYAVCDSITVLRNGKFIGDYEIGDLPRLELISKMMGKEIEGLDSLKSHKHVVDYSDKVPLIETQKLGNKGWIKPFDYRHYAGEVVGITGLLGSGRSELVRSIYSANVPDCGELIINGKPVTIKTPLDAMKQGMAYLPEDRKKDGIIADLSVKENIIIALQAKRGLFKPLTQKEMATFADKYIEMLSIKTAHRDTPIKNLSGGNQQKCILGRWLLTNPDYLILDEPTRGIDIGTKTEIQKIVLKLASEGMAITFISSEIEEMLRTCTRLVVMRDREKIGELTGSKLNEDDVMRTIAGGISHV